MKFSASLLLSALATSSAFVAQQPSQSVRVGSTEMYARKAFITGNWKLNPQTKDEAVELATGIAEAVTKDSPGDVALFVPFPFIETVQDIVGDKVIIGAEVCYDAMDVAYVGLPLACISDSILYCSILQSLLFSTTHDFRSLGHYPPTQRSLHRRSFPCHAQEHRMHLGPCRALRTSCHLQGK